MYRLYSLAAKRQLTVSLAHANADQPDLELFDDQAYLGRCTGALNLFRFLRNSRSWLRANSNRFDVMHALGGYHYSVGPADIAESLGLPVVLFIANHGLEFTDKPGIKGLLGLPRKRREIIQRLSCLVSMSTDIHEELREYSVANERIARIPMGVNISRFNCVSSEQKREIRNRLGIKDRPTLVFSGRVEPRKRPHLLVEAMAEVINKHRQDCQLLLVGPTDRNAEYADEIREIISAAGISESVNLVGFTREIESYLQAADFFALPSENEGMPAAMVEAMACGLPCLGTAISGIRDLIDDGNDGYIVQPTAQSIADALLQYLNEPAKLAAHSKLCRSKVIERYSADAVLQAHLKLFKIVMTGGKPSDASILPEIS
jgi:glycosyltransferase involved in cell wall biosynthesis